MQRRLVQPSRDCCPHRHCVGVDEPAAAAVCAPWMRRSHRRHSILDCLEWSAEKAAQKPASSSGGAIGRNPCFDARDQRWEGRDVGEIRNLAPLGSRTLSRSFRQRNDTKKETLTSLTRHDGIGHSSFPTGETDVRLVSFIRAFSSFQSCVSLASGALFLEHGTGLQYTEPIRHTHSQPPHSSKTTAACQLSALI